MHHARAGGYLNPQTMSDDTDYHSSIRSLGDVAEEEEEDLVRPHAAILQTQKTVLLLCQHLSRLCGRPRS